MSSGGEDDKNRQRSSSIGGSPLTNLGPNCANFIAGIIEGILNSSKMYCKCFAHFVAEEEEQEESNQDYSDEGNVYRKKKEKKVQTLYVIKFEKEVTQRDLTMGN